MIEQCENPVRPCSRRVLFLLAANVLSLLALSLILFRLQAPVTFFRYDGTFILSVAKNQAEWVPGFLTYTMDFLKGMGEQWFPIDTKLMPSFILARLGGDGNWFAALAATGFALEFAIGTFIIARTFAFSIPVTVVAIWLGLLGAFPYVVPTPVLELSWGNPHVMSFIVLTLISLSLYLDLGRRSIGDTIIRAGAIFLILSYLTIVNLLSIPMLLPVIVFFGSAALMTTSDASEFIHKSLAGIILCSGYLIFYGPWLAGYFVYTKPVFFWTEMYPTNITWNWTSLLLENPHDRPLGVALYIIALLGGALAALRKTGRPQRLATAYLLFVALTWIVTGFLTVSHYPWPGPPISYMDWVIYPLHACYAVYFLYCMARMAASRIQWTISLPLMAMTATIFLPWIALATWVPPYDKPLFKNEVPFRWPPLRTPIVDFLVRHIALQPGHVFRGRVVNLAGGTGDKKYQNAPYINQHNYDAVTAFYLGNDHREYGFWFYDIPTLEDTNHLQTPFYHLLVGHLLNPEGSWFFRVHETATLFAPKLLAQLGVRYALTDELVKGLKPVLQITLAPGRYQYLYEIPDANVAGRSVTQVSVVKTAAEAIALLKSPSLDLKKEAVLFEPLPAGPLVDATESSLVVDRGFLTISADAPGRALLVLPIEYSRCLKFFWESPTDQVPKVFRADIAQTAILFSGHIQGRIELWNGPFHHRTCRLHDLEDARAVDLEATANIVRNGTR